MTNDVNSPLICYPKPLLHNRQCHRFGWSSKCKHAEVNRTRGRYLCDDAFGTTKRDWQTATLDGRHARCAKRLAAEPWRTTTAASANWSSRTSPSFT